MKKPKETEAVKPEETSLTSAELDDITSSMTVVDGVKAEAAEGSELEHTAVDMSSGEEEIVAAEELVTGQQATEVSAFIEADSNAVLIDGSVQPNIGVDSASSPDVLAEFERELQHKRSLAKQTEAQAPADESTDDVVPELKTDEVVPLEAMNELNAKIDGMKSVVKGAAELKAVEEPDMQNIPQATEELTVQKSENIETFAKAGAVSDQMEQWGEELGITEKSLAAIGIDEKAQDGDKEAQAVEQQAVVPNTADNVTDDTADNVTDDTADNVADDTADNVADDIADNVADDTADNVVDDIADNVADDIADNVVDDIADNVVDDIADNVADDIADNVADSVNAVYSAKESVGLAGEELDAIVTNLDKTGGKLEKAKPMTSSPLEEREIMVSSEFRDLFMYLDNLMGSLPKRQLEIFARSQHYRKYTNIISKLKNGQH